MSATPLPADAWTKSSYSAAGNECIEVNAAVAGVVGVRDSKDLSHRPFTIGADAFRILIQAIRTDAL